MKQSWVFTENKWGDGGVAEAARFVGAWAGCVPNSREWKVLVATIEGFENLDDDELAEAYEAAIVLLTRGREE